MKTRRSTRRKSQLKAVEMEVANEDEKTAEAECHPSDEASSSSSSSMGKPTTKTTKPILRNFGTNTDDDFANLNLKDLTASIKSLHEKINLMQSTLENLLDMRKTMDDRPLQSSVAMETTKSKPQNRPRSYAEVAAKPNSTSVSDVRGKSLKGTASLDNKTSKTIEKNDNKKKNKNDVTKPEKSKHVITQECEKSLFDDKVAIIHDSVLNGIQRKRIGISYGFTAFKKTASTIADIPKAIDQLEDKQNLKVIVLHVGVNDLKSKDPKTASQQMVETVKKVAQQHQGVKFVISKIAAVNEKKLRAKRDVFNALTFSSLMEEPNISFVAHDNMSTYALKDSVHPNRTGSSILAGNIGRLLHSMFWKKPSSRNRARHHHRASAWFKHYDFDWRNQDY